MPDAMIAIMCPSVGVIVSAAPVIVPRNPAAPTVAIMTRHPDPVIAFMPITASVIVRPIAHCDFEADRLRLRHHRRGHCHDCCQKNQKFSFHIVFDPFAGKLFSRNKYFVIMLLPMKELRREPDLPTDMSQLTGSSPFS